MQYLVLFKTNKSKTPFTTVPVVHVIDALHMYSQNADLLNP